MASNGFWQEVGYHLTLFAEYDGLVFLDYDDSIEIAGPLYFQLQDFEHLQIRQIFTFADWLGQKL